MNSGCGVSLGAWRGVKSSLDEAELCNIFRLTSALMTSKSEENVQGSGGSSSAPHLS